MSSIIEKMKQSSSELLKAEGADLAKWSKLKHTKEDFELFLNFNIAEISYKTLEGEDRTMVCTSNAALIKVFSLVKESDKKKAMHLKTNGIRTKAKRSVDTWDLIENKRKTVSLNSWAIINFISITPKNILILDELMKKLLKA